MNPALYKILETHYRSKRLGLIILAAVCVVIILIAIGWTASSLLDHPSAYRCPPRARNYSACVSSFYADIMLKGAAWTVITGIVLAVTGYKLWQVREVDVAPLVVVFTSRRDDVAWLYHKRTSVRRYGVEVRQIHEAVAGLTSKKRHSVTLAGEGEVQEALRLMAEEAPRARRGWSQENEFAFARDPSSMLSPAEVPVRTATAVPVRMVVAADYAFSRIDTAVRYLGLNPEGALAPQVAPGEPSSAAWAGRGARITYTLDPRAYLRVMELSGVEPERLRQELSTVVGVPALDLRQVLELMTRPDPRWTLLGVLAAEALGVGDDRRAYREPISRLVGHPDPSVAQAAQRVMKAWA
jgi:hypothetical protein